MLDRLEFKGFLSRVRSKADRRTVKVTLTAHGRDLLPVLRERVASVLQSLLHGLSAEEVIQLERLLMRVLDNA